MSGWEVFQNPGCSRLEHISTPLLSHLPDMTFTNFSNAKEKYTNCSSKITKCIITLMGITNDGEAIFSYEQNIPSTTRSITFFQNQMTSIQGIIDALSKLDSEGYESIPSPWLDEFSDCLNNLESSCIYFMDEVSKLKNLALITHADPSNFDLDFANTDGNGEYIHAGQHLTLMYSLIGRVHSVVARIFVLTKPKRFSAFSTAAQTIGSMISKARNTLDEIDKVAGLIESKKELIDNIETNSTDAYSRIESLESNIKSLLENSENHSNGIEENVAQAESSIENIEQHSNEAKSRSESIKILHSESLSYKQKIEELGLATEEYKDVLTANDQATKELIAKNERSQEEIISLRSKAEDMLKGATNASLAHAFATRRDVIDKQLTIARWKLIAGFFLMVASAGPLIIYVIAQVGLLGLFTDATVTPSESKDFWQHFGRMAGFLILMGPSIWMMKLWSRDYSSLFRLRELYAHKAALAQSLEGFKLQAGDGGTEISKQTFEQMTKRPLDDEPRHEDSFPTAGSEAFNQLVAQVRKAMPSTPSSPN